MQYAQILVSVDHPVSPPNTQSSAHVGCGQHNDQIPCGAPDLETAVCSAAGSCPCRQRNRAEYDVGQSWPPLVIRLSLC